MGLFLHGAEQRSHANEVVWDGPLSVSVFKETCVYLWPEKKQLFDAVFTFKWLFGCTELPGPRNPVGTLCTAVMHDVCSSGVLAVYGIIRLHTSTQMQTGASSAHRTGGVQIQTRTLRWMGDWLMEKWSFILKYWQNEVNVYVWHFDIILWITHHLRWCHGSYDLMFLSRNSYIVRQQLHYFLSIYYI